MTTLIGSLGLHETIINTHSVSEWNHLPVEVARCCILVVRKCGPKCLGLSVNVSYRSPLQDLLDLNFNVYPQKGFSTHFTFTYFTLLRYTTTSSEIETGFCVFVSMRQVF